MQLSVYTIDWWQKSKSASFDHNDGRPISIWRQIYIFKDHNIKHIWKTKCYSCTYLIIITSETIFTVFLQIFFSSHILRNKIDPMPLDHHINTCIHIVVYVSTLNFAEKRQELLSFFFSNMNYMHMYKDRCSSVSHYCKNDTFACDSPLQLCRLNRLKEFMWENI
jgi:hypothetical protein